MIESKEWNWAVVTDETWNTASEDVYYYLDRWSTRNFSTFLDLGCGLGRHTTLFASRGFETHGFDLSEYAITSTNRKANELNLNIKTQLGDIQDLPYASEQFDCLLAYHVISHTDTQGIQKTIKEIGRVLKTNGEFFISLCSKASPAYSKDSNIIIDNNTIIKMEEPEVNIPHFYCELEDVKVLMSGFEILKVRHIEDIFENYNNWHYFIHGKKI